MKYLAIIVLSVFTLVGCATVPKQSAWPSDIPPYSFYFEAYQQDLDNQVHQSLESYLKWVVGFYQGTDFYSAGWHQTTRGALQDIDVPADRANAKNKLQWIGKKVSAEWAKSNSLRLINTRHVAIWATSLDESIVQGKPLVYIGQVVRDVDAILAGVIEPDDITDYRYFSESEDFFF
ncbi:MAG: hypothetical protein COB94_004210 [Gammaproteobacteria bacterium]|nr:hypothetical protein [Gammaproteobacteria bacterium]